MINKLIISLIVMLTTITNITAQTITQINSGETLELLSNKNQILVLDVRTHHEFVNGHLKDAINIDFYENNFYNRIDSLNKKNTYLVYCRTQNRSGMTVEYMKQKGFVKIYQLVDGFSGWASKNFAYVK